MYIFNLIVSLNKISRRLSFLCIVFLSIVFLGNAQTPTGFNLVTYEGFNYSSGSSLLNANGGSGWTSSWGQSYQQRYLRTATTGFSYTGLSTQGLKAEFDPTCYGTCNAISSLNRSLPLQDQGVVYFQFISVFEANAGGGTPTIRLFNASTMTGVIGAHNGSFMSISSPTTDLSSSTASLSAQNLVVVRIDYNLNKTDMWINPNLSTFDYLNPTSPSASASGFSPSFDRIDIYLRSGSIDEISVFSQTTSSPTSISGTASICNGTSTTLTASGGTTNSNVVDLWYAGTCGGEAFSEGWDTQPYATSATTVNSTANGILNVTSTSVDPMINMFGIGSFDPSVHKYINFRYRVVSGTAGSTQIFFLNSTYTVPTGGISSSTTLVSDNAWHIGTIDMSTNASWTTGGNITGWRFDYATGSGATMDIDFIELGTTPIIGTGLSILVTPSVNTTYYVNRKGPNANTACASQLVTVNALPIPTFTAQPGVTTAVNSDVTYITESGQANYVWTIPGVLNTDYSITSGGTTTDNTIVLKWLITGSKAVTVNYNNSNNCSATVATSSISTEVLDPIVTKNGGSTIVYSNSLNKNGAIGSASRLNSNGKIIVGAGSGLSSAAAGTSAMQIKTDFPSSVDGVYWIDVPGYGPKQTYCLMDSAYDGGGWMLALKATTGTTFNYAASYWTTANTLNPTDVTRNNSDAKYDVMNGFLAKDMMALWPDIPNSAAESGSIDGLTQWSWLQNNFNTGTRITPISFFTTINNSFISDANLYSGKGVRFSGQTQVRFYGFNYTVNATAKVRWGFAWNENSVGLFPSGNQTSNDVSGGIGMGSGYGNYSAGDKINCCQNSIGINRSARVEVFIR